MATSHKVIEAGVTVFSAAEIHVVGQPSLIFNLCLGWNPSHLVLCLQAVIAIGDVPEDILLRYMSLISRHRQVMLATRLEPHQATALTERN